MNDPIVFHLLVLLAVAVIAKAQSDFKPRSTSRSAYAKYKDRLYIYGGNTFLISPYFPGTTTQLIALDLAKTWPSKSPAWIKLKDGDSSFTDGAVISRDGKTFMVFPHTGITAAQYSIENDTWSDIRLPYSSEFEIQIPVALPTDNTALIVRSDHYIFYSFDTGQVVSTSLPPYGINGVTYLPERDGYRAVWSEYLKSAVVVGGGALSNRHGVPPDHWVSLYRPETKEWSTLKTFGINAGKSAGHCVAISDDGKRMFSYGEAMKYWGNSSTDLAMLNLETGEWFQCTNSNLNRSNVACTVSGDYFILWGGSTDYNGQHEVVGVYVYAQPIHLYQISKNAWVDEYQPFTEYRDPFLSSKPSPSPSLNTSDESHGSLSAGHIASIVAGAIGVMAVIGFLVWTRKRQRIKHSRQQDDPSSTVDHPISRLEGKGNYHGGAKRSPQSHIQLTTLQSSQSPDDTYYGDDDLDKYWYIHRRNSKHPTVRGPPLFKSMSAKNASMPYPLSDSLNVHPNSKYTENRVWANPTALGPSAQMDDSRTQRFPSPRDMFVSPPPLLVSLCEPPVLSRLRNPQEIDQRRMLQGELNQTRDGDGWPVDELPGPQWLPG